MTAPTGNFTKQFEDYSTSLTALTPTSTLRYDGAITAEAFTEFLHHVSTTTNRSIAGKTLYCQETLNEHMKAIAHAWGVTIIDNTEIQSPQTQYNSCDNHDSNPTQLTKTDGTYNTTPQAQAQENLHHTSAEIIEHYFAEIFDQYHSFPAMKKIMQAYSGMNICKQLASNLSQTNVEKLCDARIVINLVLEPKTAVLALILRAFQAQVGVYCTAHETQQDVADLLQALGIHMAANSQWDIVTEQRKALEMVDSIHPTIVIDDGGSLARLIARERPAIAQQLWGVAEETTSGVRAFEAMAADHALPFPVVISNNSPLKTLFDNTHGTGETCITTIQSLLGTHILCHAKLTVIGFGPVGRGFAQRARALGATVTICERNPINALQAAYEGFRVDTLSQAIAYSDIIVSATGVVHTITLEDCTAMRHGTILAVIGGIANEIALDDIERSHTLSIHNTDNSQIQHIVDNAGKTITLLAHGDGVNYTAGSGNPIEIMDLSFAVQWSAVMMILEQHSTLQPALYEIGKNDNQHIAEIALQTLGYTTDRERNIEINWHTTRFDMNDGQ